MKTLSVRQPWANLIVHGIKDIENRTWKTNYRGRIYIHAPSLSVKLYKICHNEIDNSIFCRNYENNYEYLFDQLLFSAIIGTVEIINCIRDSKSTWADPDCWHWTLKNPELFKEPILNVKGKLSLWEYSPDA